MVGAEDPAEVVVELEGVGGLTGSSLGHRPYDVRTGAATTQQLIKITKRPNINSAVLTVNTFLDFWRKFVRDQSIGCT